MLLVIVAGVIGYAIGGGTGAVLAAVAVMGAGVLMHLATPKADRETSFEFRMRTDEGFHEMVRANYERSGQPGESFHDYLMRTNPKYRETVLARTRQPH